MDIVDHLDENPGLKPLIEECVTKAYMRATIAAASETGLPARGFPPHCPRTFGEMTAEAFWTEA
jgi:hypothetical protein